MSCLLYGFVHGSTVAWFCWRCSAETRARMALYYEIVEQRTALRKHKRMRFKQRFKMTRETSNLVAAYSCEHARGSRARYMS